MLNAKFLRASLPTAFLLAGLLLPVNSRGLERDLTLSVYQSASSQDDFSANLSTARRVVEEAKGRQTDFLLFPELFLSGCSNRAEVERAARPYDDPDLRAFVAESSAHNMVVIVGLAHVAKRGEPLYDNALVIYHGKMLGACDKIMLNDHESSDLDFRPGRSSPVLFANGARFAVIIGQDLATPHLAMAARYQGAEMIFNPTVTSEDDAVGDGSIGLARELKLAVARAGALPDRPGHSPSAETVVVSPQGEIIARASSRKPQLVTARITTSMFAGNSALGDFNQVPSWVRTQLAQQLTDFRQPTDDDDLRYWLANMVTFHRFTPAEVSDATGFTVSEAKDLLRKFGIAERPPATSGSDSPLRLLPYPGGRHPRIGFLDGAVMPRRETKFSVFTPWDDASYVVDDVPEAVWSNLGLIYLAHTHVLSLWDKKGIVLPRQEWTRSPDGTLTSERLLPNGVSFGAKIVPALTEVRMQLWLSNGAPQTLTGLRIQNCVMLKGAAGFTAQTSTNKLFQKPFAAVHDVSGQRWVITAWDSCDRCWGNEQVPCIHSDPKFADCPAGQTVQLRGWLSLYQGSDVASEFKRIEQAHWLRQ